ncbi:MAG: nucleotidyltransferase, partial [Bacteroidota bacterium]|nr:nucleotidyltransferase [Bacteroidota bacterium]
MQSVNGERTEGARAFYREALKLLDETGAEFMLGGGFALYHFTGIVRDTKDLDIFCRSSDYTKILKYFAEQGYEVQLYDVRWLAKVKSGDDFIDIIWDTVNNICRVDNSWFERAPVGEYAGHKVKFIPAEELLWCKIYVQNRERYDGSDVNHLILRYGAKM